MKKVEVLNVMRSLMTVNILKIKVYYEVTSNQVSITIIIITLKKEKGLRQKEHGSSCYVDLCRLPHELIKINK